VWRLHERQNLEQFVECSHSPRHDDEGVRATRESELAREEMLKREGNVLVFDNQGVQTAA
jgi:hypothetical protein